MRPQLRYIIGAVVGIAIIISLLNSDGGMTGAASYQYRGEERETYAYALNDWVRGFFQVEGVAFPNGDCTLVANDLYKDIAFQALSVTEDFSTHGKSRVSSVMFGFEDNTVGALELIHGPALVSVPDADSSLNLIAERPVRAPKLTRVSNIELSLFGLSRDKLYVTGGKIRTPTLECDFFVEDGRTVCDCKIERTYDYAAKKVGSGIYNREQE